MWYGAFKDNSHWGSLVIPIIFLWKHVEQCEESLFVVKQKTIISLFDEICRLMQVIINRYKLICHSTI